MSFSVGREYVTVHSSVTRSVFMRILHENPRQCAPKRMSFAFCVHLLR